MPGTQIEENQLKQCRRWLQHQRHNVAGHFPFEAIEEVNHFIRKETQLRTNFAGLSLVAKQIVATYELERGPTAPGQTGTYLTREALNPGLFKDFSTAEC